MTRLEQEKYEFKCLGEPERPITEDMCRQADVSYAAVFSRAEDMAGAALEIKRLNRDVWVKLPFCVTIEAECFGADVAFNSLYGVPAVTRFKYEKLTEIEALPEIDLQQGRVAEVLRAAEMLHRQGEKIMLNIEGPFTVLGQLISVKEIYKGLYRQPEKLRELCLGIGRQLAVYGAAAEKHGVDLLSYADPAVAGDLVAPAIYRDLCGDITWQVLHGILANTSRVAVHLCNAASRSFEKAGFCTARHLEFSPEYQYGQALKEVVENGQERLLGHGCIQRSYCPLCNGGVFTLQLSEGGQAQMLF